jgi:cytochrome c oxidase subunit IV
MTNESQEPASFLERAEHHIYLAAGYILISAAAGLLVAAVIEVVKHMLTGDYAAAIVSLLDRVLLALMIAEITYSSSFCSPGPYAW